MVQRHLTPALLSGLRRLLTVCILVLGAVITVDIIQTVIVWKHAHSADQAFRRADMQFSEVTQGLRALRAVVCGSSPVGRPDNWRDMLRCDDSTLIDPRASSERR